MLVEYTHQYYNRMYLRHVPNQVPWQQNV